MANHNPLNHIQQLFCDYIRHPEKTLLPENLNKERIALYHTLVRNNFNSFLKNAFPVCYQILQNNHWDPLVDSFLAEHVCHHPLFQKIPEEFLKFLNTHPFPDFPFLLELAHYEWVALDLDTRMETIPPTPTISNNQLLLQTPSLSPLLYLLYYQYPVHQVGLNYQPTDKPEAPTYLLVYRNHHDIVNFLVLNAVSARLLELLQKKKCTGKEALLQIAEELHHPDPTVVLNTGQDTLRHWLECDIILGVEE